MALFAKPAYIAIDADVVGRIAKDHLRLVALHELGIGSGLERARAVHPAFAHRPFISDASYRRSQRDLRQIIGGIIRRGRTQALDAKIDLAHLEPGDLETKIEVQ